MCGGKHTGPLPLCRPDSILTPPPHRLLQLIDTREALIPLVPVHWGLESPVPINRKTCLLCPPRQLKARLFLRGAGVEVVNPPDLTVSFYLVGFGLGSEHSWMLLNGVLWVTRAPRDHQRPMGEHKNAAVGLASSLTHPHSSNPPPIARWTAL